MASLRVLAILCCARAAAADPDPTGEVIEIHDDAPRWKLGAAVGARWQGGFGMRIAGFADAAVGGWLVGANAGWTSGAGDQALADTSGGTVPTAYTSGEIEAGFELGHKLRLGAAELTALVGPRIAKTTRSFDPAGMSLGFDVRDVHETRFASSVRVKWARASRVQLLVGFEASVDLAMTYGDAHVPPAGPIAQPVPMTLPLWAFALTVGGEVAP